MNLFGRHRVGEASVLDSMLNGERNWSDADITIINKWRLVPNLQGARLPVDQNALADR
jgi:hypothetical protein